MGRLDVIGMLREMPAGLLRAWYEYAQVEPFGEDRADLRAGIVAAAVVNVTRQVNYSGRGARPKPVSPTDFMPDFSGRAPRRKPLSDPNSWAALKGQLREGMKRV